MSGPQTSAGPPEGSDSPLEEDAAAYRLLVDSVVDYAIYLLGPDGRVRTWNRGAERLKGYTREEIVGKSYAAFFTEEDRARGHPDEELRIARDEGRFEEEGWRVRKDGRRFWAGVVLTALRDGGELVGFAKVTRDLTERKKAEEEREKLLEREHRSRVEAEEASRAKSEFLAVMSHELRTPLNAISGYTDLILAGVPEPVPEKARHQVERIRIAAEHQLRMVEEILAFSRLEAGHSAVTREWTDLAAVAREALEAARPHAEEKELRIHIDVPDDPALVRTDRAKVRQIVGGLLSNAVKFTAEGEIRVGVEMNGAQALVRVRDEGIGVRPEDREKIFRSFWQAEQSTVREVDGIGLGLSVSRGLARLLGGEIEVESRSGEGSTFTLRLPVEAGEGE